jgi:hypothetical protein
MYFIINLFKDINIGNASYKSGHLEKVWLARIYSYIFFENGESTLEYERLENTKGV